jgi:hypothetical protein
LRGWFVGEGGGFVVSLGLPLNSLRGINTIYNQL